MLLSIHTHRRRLRRLICHQGGVETVEILGLIFVSLVLLGAVAVVSQSSGGSSLGEALMSKLAELIGSAGNGTPGAGQFQSAITLTPFAVNGIPAALLANSNVPVMLFSSMGLLSVLLASTQLNGSQFTGSAFAVADVEPLPADDLEFNKFVVKQMNVQTYSQSNGSGGGGKSCGQKMSDCWNSMVGWLQGVISYVLGALAVAIVAILAVVLVCVTFGLAIPFITLAITAGISILAAAIVGGIKGAQQGHMGFLEGFLAGVIMATIDWTVDLLTFGAFRFFSVLRTLTGVMRVTDQVIKVSRSMRAWVSNAVKGSWRGLKVGGSVSWQAIKNGFSRFTSWATNGIKSMLIGISQRLGNLFGGRVGNWFTNWATRLGNNHPIVPVINNATPIPAIVRSIPTQLVPSNWKRMWVLSSPKEMFTRWKAAVEWTQLANWAKFDKLARPMAFPTLAFFVDWAINKKPDFSKLALGILTGMKGWPLSFASSKFPHLNTNLPGYGTTWMHVAANWTLNLKPYVYLVYDKFVLGPGLLHKDSPDHK